MKVIANFMWDIHKGYQGRASKILDVHSISATWNRVDRTRGPTWRLQKTRPCAVRVVPSYARTAVVRSKARRIQIQLPGCTQCTNMKSCTTFYPVPHQAASGHDCRVVWLAGIRVICQMLDRKH